MIKPKNSRGPSATVASTPSSPRSNTPAAPQLKSGSSSSRDVFQTGSSAQPAALSSARTAGSAVPWKRPPLPGNPAKGPGAVDASGQPFFPDRWAYSLDRSGTANIGSFTMNGPGNYANGAGQTVLQIGAEKTPQGLGAYIAPRATYSDVSQAGGLAAMFNRSLVPGATVVFTTVIPADQRAALLDAVQRGNKMNPPVTFVIPSVISSWDPGDAAAKKFLEDLKKAGAIVAGTSTPPGALGQLTVGSPTLRVDSYEHSAADSMVASTIALLKQEAPNISNAEIARLLQAGSSPYLDVGKVLGAAGLVYEPNPSIRPPTPPAP